MLTDYQDSCSRVSDFGLSWDCRSIVYLSSQDELCIPQLSCLGFQLRYTSRRSSLLSLCIFTISTACYLTLVAGAPLPLALTALRLALVLGRLQGFQRSKSDKRCQTVTLELVGSFATKLLALLIGNGSAGIIVKLSLTDLIKSLGIAQTVGNLLIGLSSVL